MLKKIGLFFFVLLILNMLTLIVFSQTFSASYVYPPVRNPSLAGKHVEVVNVYQYYQKEPAPMGIADYGVYPNNNSAFVLTSTAFLGEIQLNSLIAQSNSRQSPNSVSFQLNVVLNYQYNGKNYAIWVQDVAVYNTQTRQIYFVDNIWNMTTPTASVNGLSGNGKIYTYQGIKYYAYVASNYPGSPATLTLPTTFYLLVNVTVNSKGQPVIYFWYNDGYGWINYDIVTLTKVQNTQNVYFLINGNQYTGSGNFYDAELVLGGPGGGSSATVSQANMNFYLMYKSGSTFTEVQYAYDFGSDTAETSNNVLVSAGQYNGGVYAILSAGSGSLGPL